MNIIDAIELNGEENSVKKNGKKDNAHARLS